MAETIKIANLTGSPLEIRCVIPSNLSENNPEVKSQALPFRAMTHVALAKLIKLYPLEERVIPCAFAAISAAASSVGAAPMTDKRIHDNGAPITPIRPNITTKTPSEGPIAEVIPTRKALCASSSDKSTNGAVFFARQEKINACKITMSATGTAASHSQGAFATDKYSLTDTPSFNFKSIQHFIMLNTCFSISQILSNTTLF